MTISNEVLDELLKGCDSVGKVRRNIHALMQHPDDQNAAIFDDIDDQMLLVGMNADRRIEPLPLGCQHRCVGQALKPIIHSFKIDPALILAPFLLGVATDLADIGLRGFANPEPRHYSLSSSR